MIRLVDSHGPARFDRREALFASTMLALGGVLGPLAAATGCRLPQNYHNFPSGSPTSYVVDWTLCTRCGDCERVCPCKAVGGHPDDPEQCWIHTDKCCGCGRCYRVCAPLAIVPCYGPDKRPARDLPAHVKLDVYPTHWACLGPGRSGSYCGQRNEAKETHCRACGKPKSPEQCH
jgi:NAD-dependent dihydropyrimidine dehydrogenase PreA subunit